MSDVETQIAVINYSSVCRFNLGEENRHFQFLLPDCSVAQGNIQLVAQTVFRDECQCLSNRVCMKVKETSCPPGAPDVNLPPVAPPPVAPPPRSAANQQVCDHFPMTEHKTLHLPLVEALPDILCVAVTPAIIDDPPSPHTCRSKSWSPLRTITSEWRGSSTSAAMM